MRIRVRPLAGKTKTGAGKTVRIRARRLGARPRIEFVAITELKPPRRNARAHSRAQIQQIANSIRTFGFLVPLVVDEAGNILAGVGRFHAAKQIGLRVIPVIRAAGLTEAQRRAFAIADNKIGDNSTFDRKALAAELPELTELLLAEKLDISLVGFAQAEIDNIVFDFEHDTRHADENVASLLSDTPISRLGDTWQLGNHKLRCDDARKQDALKHVLGKQQVAMAFLDPPYNLSIPRTLGRGRIKHGQFVMASGEKTPAQYVAFLKQALAAAVSVSKNGAIHFICIDWRHITELLEAGHANYSDLLNLIVWVKTNAGQGSFYRSQHELICAFKVGAEPHLNNVQLGRYGRNRSNVWQYAGVNSMKSDRLEELKAHPTVKPLPLVVDAIKDCTARGDVVLDTFCGYGTTLIAAERTGRTCFGVELDPRYVDAAIRRWQRFTKRDAILDGTSCTFDELAKRRNRRAA